VRWRKRSSGTASVKGHRWVERILSLRQTCRQLGESSFGVLVDALSSAFRGRQPDLSWLYYSPFPSTPCERVRQNCLKYCKIRVTPNLHH
jgi:hypothetical protein